MPLENAYLNEFYGEMITFIRSLFESALKTNDSLEFAVITGCLRISKESIFTGLNNLEIISILEDNYAEYFGFTEKEVEGMLRDYGIMEHLDTVRQWYDGYLFGDTEVYNPWSVLSYVKTAVSSKKAFPKAYWSNTSSNSIVRKLIERADAGVRTEIEALIAGGSIRKPMHEEITYEDMDTSQENLWNFLFFTGYLKVVGQHFEINTIYVDLAIPNEEIRYIYQNTIREWFNQKMEQTDFKGFYQDILSGNAEGMEDFISEQLAGSISYYDRAESFYHGYLLGVLSGIHGYKILSNRENGKGRPDIVLKPFHPKKPAVIFELKYAKKFTGMKKLCNEALEQIEKKEYARGLLDEGYTKILKYGICFCEKSCMIKCGDTAM